MPEFYEFFAGGGMARLGLGAGWRCLLANDFSAKKAAAYRANFPPADELIVGDVYGLTTADLPGQADLAWASFPCQDLSLAGRQKGLRGERSGSFWGFWRLMEGLQAEGRTVPLIVLENVVGTISARGGEDFTVLLDTLVSAGYRVGPLVLNAVHWLPQSRPRLFVVGVHESIDIPVRLRAYAPNPFCHPSALQAAYGRASEALKGAWVWWNLPRPPHRRTTLIDLLEEEPTGVRWHTAEETQRLFDLMPPMHRAKVAEAQKQGRAAGTVYRRIRANGEGAKAQVAEIRFDGVSGCLRTGSGGVEQAVCLPGGGGQAALPAAVDARGGAPDGAAGGLPAAGELQRGVSPAGGWAGGAGGELVGKLPADAAAGGGAGGDGAACVGGAAGGDRSSMNTEQMDSARALAQLRDNLPDLRARYGVRSLALFGSVVRGEATPESDLDILVEYEDAPTLFEFVRLRAQLSELLGAPVDLVMRSALKPVIGAAVLAEAVEVVG